MSVVKFRKIIFLLGTMIFSTKGLYALTVLDINYPSVAQLKQLDAQLDSIRAKKVEKKSRMLAKR